MSGPTQPDEIAARLTLLANQARLSLQDRLDLIEAATLLRELAALRKDKERLDWLDSRSYHHLHHETGDCLGFEWCVTSESESFNHIRAAIDAAIAQAAQSPQARAGGEK